MTTEDALDDAKQLLEDRYGNPFVVAEAFRLKLEQWPKIPVKDGLALCRFSDFLRQCKTAMKGNPKLDILNDDHQNRRLLTKLPDWVVTRWARIVSDDRDNLCCFPPFELFADFVVKEARITCDPSHLFL